MRVIIVEKNRGDSHLLRDLLESFEDIGFIKDFQHPLEALSSIKEYSPDVLFIDTEGESLNVIEMVPWSHGAVPDLKVVLLSSDEKLAVKAFEVGAIDYLVKPITISRLNITMTNIRKWLRLYPKRRMSIKTLGSFDLVNDKGLIIRWRTRKAKELFAFLWYHRFYSVNRDVLIETLFPNEDLKKSSSLLSTTLYQLRDTLTPLFEGEVIQYLNNGYQLKINIGSDYEELTDILSSKDYSLNNFNRIKSLYIGDLMDNEGYEWIESERLEVKLRVRDFIHELYISLQKQDNLRDLENILHFVYKLDPLDEEVAIEILEYYSQMIQPTKFEKFYEEYQSYNYELFASAPSAHVKKNMNF